MKILLTGAAGFLGSVIAPRLAESGHILTGLDSCIFDNCHVAAKPHWKKFLFEDVNDQSAVYLQAIQESDVVIHLAAMVGAGICVKHPTLAQKTNADSVRWLVDQLRPDQYLAIPDSNSAYGTTPPGVIADEDYPMTPLSLYAKTKLEGEKIALEHPNSFVPRLATVYGVSPRMRLDLIVNFITLQCFVHKKFELFAGHTRRNYVHISDVADMFAHAIDNNLTGVFNFGNDEINCTKAELVTKVREHLDFDLTYSDKEDSDKRDYEISSKKMRDTGFTASRDLSYGIKELIEFYKTFPKNPAELSFFTRNFRNA